MINITSKYALKGLQSLAKSNSFLSIDMLAKDSGVSKPYLAKVMKQLALANIIDSKKGLNGGFKIKDSNKAITLFDVVSCLNDPVVANNCFLHKSQCNLSAKCQYHSAWSKLREELINFLKQTIIIQPSSKKK